ncbi:MAG: hypothetical protein RMJ07_02775 [Nitrososphaerota archaeon]|nr:hypothetical protein [Nitrososphaerota archaeon]
MKRISYDEWKHYGFWREYAGKDVQPDRLKVWIFLMISRIFGVTFGIKLMESGEEAAQVTYEKISACIPLARSIIEDEDKREK